MSYVMIIRTQCGNLRIFLSFRFVREIEISESTVSKSTTLTHREALIFNFYEILHSLKAEIYKINKIQSP